MTGVKIGLSIPVGLGSIKELQSSNRIDISGDGEKVQRRRRNSVARELPSRKRLVNSRRDAKEEYGEEVDADHVDGVDG